MKKFKFKLEGLLKLRKIKEDVCKQDLGRMQKDLFELDKKIEANIEAIEKAREAHVESAKSGSSARELSFFPFFVDGKRSENVRFYQRRNQLKREVDDKTVELAQLKNEHKLIANMKEDKKEVYRKEYNKKEFEKIEELNSIWRILK